MQKHAPALLLIIAILALAGCAEAPTPSSGEPSFYKDLAAHEARVDAGAARDDKLSHEVGGNFTARLDGAGFTKNAAVENVSAGYHTLAEAFSGWRQSKPHNENMLNPRMRRMGIATAYAPASKYKVFWVLVMAN